MSRGDLLYVSPIMPAMTGNGLAMRAGMVLEALAADYDVHLLVVPVDDPIGQRSAAPEVSLWCAGIRVLEVSAHEHPLFRLIARVKDPRERLAAHRAYPKPSICRFATSGAVGEVMRSFPAASFSAIHVFRLYMAPFIEPYLGARPGSRPTCGLDLDDHESRKAQRLAAVYGAAGDETAAAIQRLEADKYAAMERHSLPRFDRVYVCSEADRLEIARQCGGSNLVVLPNGVRIPAERPSERRRSAPFTFLFVGNLGYYPNEDASVFFCAEVLPRLRATVRQQIRVMIVGSHPSPRVRALSTQPGVTVTGPVSDVAPYYRDSGVVVVPVRAGGGTRIKLLEAFSHGRPVVATTIGAEGIDARHGVHVLLADSPGDFAACCAELLRRPALRRGLAARAFEFVRARHSPSRLLEALRQEPPPRDLGPCERATVRPGS